MDILWRIPLLLLICVHTDSTEKCAGNEIMCIDGGCLDSELVCVKEFGDATYTVPGLPKMTVCSYGPRGKCSASCRQQHTQCCYDATGKKPREIQQMKYYRLECQLRELNEIGLRVHGVHGPLARSQVA